MKDLDIYQKQAVLSTHRNTVVTACPGAGKTTVIINRILHLMLMDAVTGIILITYTNNAANEFRKRLPAHALARLSFCGTIHGFAKWWIEEYCLDPDGNKTALTVMDEEESMDLLEALVEHYGLAKKFTKTALKEILRRTDDPPVGLCHDPEDNLYRSFLKRQWDTARYSFAGLLATARREMAKRSYEAFDLVVDEYQDASKSTHELLEGLKTSSRFYVGDANQSIFGFIGGSPERLLELAARAKSDPENWTHVQLENTYRCAAEVAHHANLVVDRMTSRTVMASRNPKDGCVDLLGFRTSAEEQIKVANDILQFRGLEDCEGGMAVLCRTNAQCDEMRGTLRSMGIPVTERRRRDQLPGLRSALVVLDYLAKPYSEGAIDAVNKITLAPKDYTAKRQHALKECKEMEGPIWVHMAPSNRFRTLVAQIKDPALQVPEETVQLIERLDKEMNDGKNEISDLAMLLRSPDFEAEVDSIPGQVTVTTIHSAKGLEWDSVWIIGCNTCYWKGSPDEERRLFYVAMTRARSYVCASWADLCSRSVKGRILDPVESDPIPAVREHLERTLPRTRLRKSSISEIDNGAKLRKSSTSEYMGLGDDSGEEKPL